MCRFISKVSSKSVESSLKDINMATAKPVRSLVSGIILDLDDTLLNTDGIVSDILKVFLGKYDKEWDRRESHKIVGMTPFEAADTILEEYKLPCTRDDFISEITAMFSERAGVTAGKAAGMEVVAVPSLPKQSQLYTSADEVISSLLDLQLEKWGLPPFEDWIEGTLPIEPWYIGGPVIKGYGRGSKVLGIPTANLSTEGYSAILSEHPSGVYFGWARLSTRGIYKMVMSIGWNPYFNNTEKTIEPWLLHDFDMDFYGEELQLSIVGYIRPETNFSSLEILIEKIYDDGKIASEALDLPLYLGYKKSPW